MHGDCPRLVVTAAPPDVVVTATAPPARQTSVRAGRVRSPGSWRRPMPACSTGCSRAAARTPPARGGDGGGRVARARSRCRTTRRGRGRECPPCDPGRHDL